MLGSFISLSRLISRMAVDGTPSSSASKRIFFILRGVQQVPRGRAEDQRDNLARLVVARLA
jgi:hypothetical protein